MIEMIECVTGVLSIDLSEALMRKDPTKRAETRGSSPLKLTFNKNTVHELVGS